MTNTQDITPALTIGQWQQQIVRGLNACVAIVQDEHDKAWLEIGSNRNDTAFSFGDTHDRSMAVGLLQVIALANAALPGDDPRKITRADAAFLPSIADIVECYGIIDGDEESGFRTGTTAADHLRTLAAKLAALLPPE